jgi:ketosteroid isomerase-like protein
MDQGADELATLDRRIDELASQGDLASLAALLADDFVYVHSNGNRQGKTEWLATLPPLADRRRRLASAVEIDRHGDVAVAIGDLDILWNDGRTVRNRYVRVYREVAGAWHAIAQRTVPAPDRG